MFGNMMQQPLLISSILEHAARQHPTQQIVSRRVEGDIHRYDYQHLAKRSRQLANALQRLGASPGDRIGTLAWNGYRHMELYYATAGIGTITHTVNPRLFPEQVRYIVNHAEDSILFFDLSFDKLVAELQDQLPSVKHFVALCDPERMSEITVRDALNYERLVNQESDQFEWPSFDENTAASLCYTSGTTGNPKGVLYSHRSTVIHAVASCMPNALNLSEDSSVLPVVPMYHVAAWGTPYSALIAGAKLVLPGAQMDGPSLFELIEAEDVDLMMGVATVWLGLLQYLDASGQRMKPGKIVGLGGGRTPRAIAQAMWEKHDAFVMPLWGMTETSPLATFGRPTKAMMSRPLDERLDLQTKAGRPIYGMEIEIFDADDRPLPHDGVAYGSLKVRGPWVIQRYFNTDQQSAFDHEGWFETGDVATIDAEGYLLIVDRKKDVIKSGGEWISSIELENAALSHPSVKQACVVGVAHPKWDERPLMLVVLKEGQSLEKDSLLALLAERVAKWWLPDDILAVDSLPLTATGKLNKLPVREQYYQYLNQRG